jgi:hypothetical protein
VQVHRSVIDEAIMEIDEPDSRIQDEWIMQVLSNVHPGMRIDEAALCWMRRTLGELRRRLPSPSSIAVFQN